MADIRVSRRVINTFSELRNIRQLPIINFHPAYASLLVDFSPNEFNFEVHLPLLENVLQQIDFEKVSEGKTVEIPVVYGGEHGPDLAETAAMSGLSESEVVALHTSSPYFVAFLGFSPGFPYLLGLDPRLAVSRKPVPRTIVPRGSVAIGGNQTGLYPTVTPGGWQIIGRTPISVFENEDFEKPIFQPGDQIQFKKISEFRNSPAGKSELVQEADDANRTGVVSGGFTDLRARKGPLFGRTHLGISPGGPADPVAHQLANRLVGNIKTAGTLEWSYGEFQIQFVRDSWISLTGAFCPAYLDNLEISFWSSIPVAAGQVLSIRSSQRNLFSYLSIHGGTVGPADNVLYHEHSEAQTPRPLHVAGAFIKKYYSSELKNLAVLRGPQISWFSDKAVDRFQIGSYFVGDETGRSGVRLVAEANLERQADYVDRELLSEGIVNGSVQVNPAGQPMLLYCEQQTTGGYPKIATVISADIYKIGQLRRGDDIRFAWVDFDIAINRYRELQRDLGEAIEY